MGGKWCEQKTPEKKEMSNKSCGSNVLEQARKRSEDAQAAGNAQFEKVWAG